MQTGSQFRAFSDAEWEGIEPLLPVNMGRGTRPGDNLKVVEGIVDEGFQRPFQK